jgi:integrase
MFHHRFTATGKEGLKMTVIALTKSNVATLALSAGKTQEIFWDADLTGFGLSVRRHKTYIIRYRAGVTQRTITLGRTNKMTLNQAKEKAQKLFAQILLGADPQADRRAAREVVRISFRSAVDQYLKWKEGEVRPASHRVIKTYLTSETYFGSFARYDLVAITRQIVAARLAEIREKVSDISAGSARAVLSAAFTRLMQEGFCDHNPVEGTKPQDERSQRERALSDDELVKVWKACDDAGEYGAILKLMILTGCRRQEIGSLRWDEVDLDEGTLTIPGSRAKNGRTHVLPLPPLALSILQSVPCRAGRDLVFGDRSAEGFVSWARAKEALNDGLADPWVIHDLRRTFRTGLSKLGVLKDIAERCVNHSRERIVDTYDTHNYRPQIAQALALWADHVESIVNGRQTKIVSIASKKKSA